MIRRMLDVVSLMLSLFKRNRRTHPKDVVVRVNLGSALRVAPGWINVDGSLNALFAGAPAPLLQHLYRWSGSRAYYTRDEYCRILRVNRYIHHNLEYGLPFNDDSVDFVYSSHLLEHLFRDDAVRLLADIRRVLKPSGWVRICVPDLAHAIDLFATGRKEQALEFFFSCNRTGRFNRHQYMYDWELLRAALNQAGFEQVVQRSFQQGQVPDLRTLDNRPEETLYVEAQKAFS